MAAGSGFSFSSSPVFSNPAFASSSPAPAYSSSSPFSLFSSNPSPTPSSSPSFGFRGLTASSSAPSSASLFGSSSSGSGFSSGMFRSNSSAAPTFEVTGVSSSSFGNSTPAGSSSASPLFGVNTTTPLGSGNSSSGSGQTDLFSTSFSTGGFGTSAPATLVDLEPGHLLLYLDKLLLLPISLGLHRLVLYLVQLHQLDQPLLVCLDLHHLYLDHQHPLTLTSIDFSFWSSFIC